jgi:hypothetical protein
MKTMLWRCGLAGWLLLALLAGGCSSLLLRQERPRVPLELDFAKVLPEGWEPIRSWTEVNIDGDEAVEYLLLFRYDAGQIGAAIYDSQIATDLVGVVDIDATPVPSATVALAPAALQPFGYYKPYRLLPSYWAYSFGGGMGQGFVAPPGQESAVVPVAVTNDGGNGPAAELVLRGGTTHLTFVWWKNQIEGYGVTQLYAAGGFEGVNWDSWGAAPKPILEIAGLTPVEDYRARSQICRETAYTRREASEDAPSAIVFDAADQGLRFCQAETPPHPFYPEGVVLAYLRMPEGDRKGLDLLLTPGVAAGQVDADVDVGRLANERIDDIATYATVQVTPGALREGEFAPTTSACVQLTGQDNADARRWLVFTLRYQPPDLERRLPDRWTISGVRAEPRPISPPAGPYCASILGRGAP